MDLRTYVAIIRKYLPFILIAGLLGLLAGFGIYKSQPKQYAADVQFYVSTPVADGGSAQASGQFATGRMTSYSELLTSQQLGERVVKATGVQLEAGQVARRITSDVAVESVLVKATVTDTDPQRALTIAEGIDKVFGKMVDELDNAGRKDPLVTINTVSEPSLHSAPVAPKPKLTMLLGLALGLGLASAVAVLREVLDNSVKTPEAVRDLAGAPVIGVIPADRSAASSPLLSSDQAGSPRTEAHRKLRTNLTFLDATRKAQVLLFTSPADGDGTSTVASNTALSFAEQGERVCLVGSNLRDADSLDAFGITAGGRGLSSVLAGRTELQQALTAWKGKPSIDVLPTGELPPNPAALLGSERFAETMAELRQRYDRIVLDSPALLPVADAAVLAAQSDGVVLVSRSGSTTAEQLTGARDALDAVRARMLGVVVNASKQVPGVGASGKRA